MRTWNDQLMIFSVHQMIILMKKSFLTDNELMKWWVDKMMSSWNDHPLKWREY
jgi:hypothetical protein